MRGTGVVPSTAFVWRGGYVNLFVGDTFLVTNKLKKVRDEQHS